MLEIKRNVMDCITRLLEEYKTLVAAGNIPDWSVKVKGTNDAISPPIPFIGEYYGDLHVKVGVYASAENLMYYENSVEKDFDYLEQPELAINRHQVRYERYKQEEKHGFFPNIHCSPFNDGGLYCAVAYIISKRSGIRFASPDGLLNSIYAGNFGKFSITSVDKNTDYASSFDHLKESFKYIEADIRILRPDYIIIPKSIWQHSKKVIKKYLPEDRVILISQINATTVNCHINKNGRLRRGKALIDENYPDLEEWTNNLHKINKNNFYSVYAYLDEIIGDSNGVIDFYQIREFAASYFYADEDGADFDWLRKHWDKFKIRNEQDAQHLILTLSYIYWNFYAEAYLLKSSSGDVPISGFVESLRPPFDGAEHIIEYNLPTVYKELFQIFGRAEEVIREFASINIDHMFPHPDIVKFILDKAELYDPRNNEDLSLPGF